MITREQVADLQPGDVVEYRRDDWPEGCYVHSPLKGDEGHGGLYVLDGFFGVRAADGRPYEDMASLTVVSRAPRPLYVNHPRTEPMPGDVVRDADNPEWNGWLYLRSDNGRWLDPSRGEWFGKAMPARLRLLVDGETGLPVGLDPASAWDEGFEAGSTWTATNPGPAGGHIDPPRNPYETGQVAP